MKRWMAFVAAAVLIAGLSGCGESAAAESSPEISEDAREQTESAAPVQEETEELSVEEPLTEDLTEQAFTRLELEITKGSLYIRSGESFSLSRHGGKPADYEIDGGTLYFENDYNGDTVLTLPESGSYEALRLTVGDGHVYVESGLELQTLELTERRGEAKLEALSVAESSDLVIEQGSAFLSGDLGSSVTASCREGHLSLELPFAKEECSYEINLTEGNLRLGGESFQGRSASRVIDNSGDRSMKLTCSRGDISVEFNR